MVVLVNTHILHQRRAHAFVPRRFSGVFMSRVPLDLCGYFNLAIDYSAISTIEITSGIKPAAVVVWHSARVDLG